MVPSFALPRPFSGGMTNIAGDLFLIFDLVIFAGVFGLRFKEDT